jgi:enoyl-[acyl-carrier protein] reductase II
MAGIGSTGEALEITRRGFVGKLAASAAAAAMAASAMSLTAHASESSVNEDGANGLCEVLGIEKPVVQALMAGLTSVELAAAVSEAGGLGILELPDADTLAQVRQLTDKPICAAYYGYDDDTAAMLREAGVNIVLYANGGSASDNGYAVDVEPIKGFKDAGFTVIYKGLNATSENLAAVQDAGADVIVVIGFGAGGCGPKIASNTCELIAGLADTIHVPMLAAGGIVNERTARLAACAGAQGAYVGTRFLASEEAPCADATKQAIVEAHAQDLVPVPWQAGSDGYMLETPSSLRDKALDMAASGSSPAEIMEESAVIYVNMASGEIADTGICVGVGCEMIESVLPVADIVSDIAGGFEA